MNKNVLAVASAIAIFSVTFSSFAAEGDSRDKPAAQSEYTGQESNTAQDKMLKAEEARDKEATQPNQKPELFDAASRKIDEQEAKGNVGGAKK